MRYRADDVRETCEDTGWAPAWGYRMMCAVAAEVEGAEEGRYLLTHSPAADHVCCFKALPSEERYNEVHRIAVL